MSSYSVEVSIVEEVGSDFIRLQDAAGSTCKITFADSETRSKEESACYFRSSLDKPVAIPGGNPSCVWLNINEDWETTGVIRHVPFDFEIAFVERSV